MITSLTLLSAFTVSLLLLWGARVLTVRLGLVDRPDERKRHHGEVPLAGGIGVYAAIVLIAIGIDLLPDVIVSVGRLGDVAIAVGGLALLLGIVDDARDLNPKLRLGCQAVIALVLALYFEVRVESLGDVLGTGDIRFGFVGAVAFTVFCVIGALNATNMIDGMDGLLASLAAFSLAALTVMMLLAPGVPELLCTIAIGALSAFLTLNLRVLGERRRVFFGDSGSMFLGMLIAVLVIGYSQGPGAPIRPVVAGWLLGLPLLDTTVVVVRRVLQRRSPLRADRDHLHHLLQDRGLSPHRTLVTMIALHAAMLAIGLVAQLSSLPAWVFLYGFVVLTLVHFAVTSRIARANVRRLERVIATRERALTPSVASDRGGRSEPPIDAAAPAAAEPVRPTKPDDDTDPKTRTAEVALSD